jgi:hypothetical protein
LPYPVHIPEHPGSLAWAARLAGQASFQKEEKAGCSASLVLDAGKIHDKLIEAAAIANRDNFIAIRNKHDALIVMFWLELSGFLTGASPRK